MTPQSQSARPDHRTASASIPVSPTPVLTRRGAGALPHSNPPVTAIPRDDERAACASPNQRRRQPSQSTA